MQDKLPLTSPSQASSNEPTLPDTESSYLHHVSTYLRKPDGPPSPKSRCFLLSLPDESLTHITTFIADPPSLFALSRASRRLRDHVADDNTWYRAFVFHFLGVGPEHDPRGDKQLMLRRTESSWKKEFVARFNLTRWVAPPSEHARLSRHCSRWAKSRNATLSYQPNYWSVSSMHLLENASLLTSNLQYGIVTRSLPLTGACARLRPSAPASHRAAGKILRGHLDASGTTNGLGIGNPNEEFTPNVSCTALASCGGTGRVAWGFLTGDVAATAAPRVTDAHRAAARYARCAAGDAHPGPVRCVRFAGADAGRVVSGCARGAVKLWDAQRMRCLWTGAADGACAALAHGARAGVLVAALEGGAVVVWRGFRFGDADVAPACVHALRIAAAADGPALGALFVDPASAPARVRILLHHAGARGFLRLAVDGAAGRVTRTAFGDGPLGALTSVTPCFAARDGRAAASFVLAGDALGTVCVWDWDAEGAPEEDGRARVRASRRWEAHDDGAVCAVEASGVVVVTGRCVRVRGAAAARSRALARQHARDGEGVGRADARGAADVREAGRGGRADARGAARGARGRARGEPREQGPRVAGGRGRGGPEGQGHARAAGEAHGGGRPREQVAACVPFLARGARPGVLTCALTEQVELSRDIAESRRLLEDERARERRALGRARAQRSTLAALGLDERGAVEYLLMLSREEAARGDTGATFARDGAAHADAGQHVPARSDAAVQVSRGPGASTSGAASFPAMDASSGSAASLPLAGSWTRGSPCGGGGGGTSTPGGEGGGGGGEEEEELRLVLALSLAEAQGRGEGV